MKKPTFAWIVEMWYDKDIWLPTASVMESRRLGEIALKRWRESQPLDKFRLGKYERKEPRT